MIGVIAGLPESCVPPSHREVVSAPMLICPSVTRQVRELTGVDVQTVVTRLHYFADRALIEECMEINEISAEQPAE